MTNHFYFRFCKKASIFFATAIFAATFFFLLGYAAPASGISVSAVIPENQVDKSKTYYDLRLAPGQQQTLQLVVRNGGDEPVVAYVDINNASTGRNGLIQYNVPGIRDDCLEIPIVDIAKPLTPEIPLAAKSEAVVDIAINMPETAFDGCILGGVVVTAETQNTGAQAELPGSLQISNNYAYAVGLKITQNDNIVKPDMHLKSIKPSLVNYRPMVTVNLQNSEAAIIKGMRIDAQVYKKNSSAIFRQMDMPDVDMAPCSSFNAGIDWNDTLLEPGEYRLKMRAEHEDQVWEWDEDFVIQNTQANQINTESVYTDSHQSIWQYAHIVICLLGFIIIIALLIDKKRKREEK